MIVNIKEITSALAKISAFAAGEKNAPGVLLDVHDTYINICYSDGRKSVIERIEANLEEGEPQTKMIVNYQKLVDIISVSQSSGRVYTDYMELIVQDKVIKVRVEKKILQHETEDGEGEYKTFSVFEQTLAWLPENANIKVALLTRMDYSKIFAEEEKDEWDIVELKSILSKTSTEKTRVTYISPKKECAFVANLASLSCYPIEDNHTIPVLFNNVVAKAVTDVLSKVTDNKVYVSIVDRKFCNIHTEDNKVGICVEMAETSTIHLNTLANYQAKEYKNYQLTFIKDILKNVVDSAMAADKADKTILKFNEVDGEPTLNIEINNSTASVSNKYTVICAGCLDGDDSINKLELPISLKVLSEIIGKCDTDYVGIDIDIDSNNVKCIRISELSLEEKLNAENEVRDRLGISEDEDISLVEQLNYRDRTLLAKHYTLSAK